ncbi:NAD(P)H dehydrogenase [Clarias magur]|uniref:NAD(P)H dehydrogenase n=1 Tax=Clarias magur TaxID=1594786 RepID=A0A8J4X7N9_CLAMG|nr:NAD(P)H dehydrogenase [Clarias magur]
MRRPAQCGRGDRSARLAEGRRMVKELEQYTRVRYTAAVKAAEWSSECAFLMPAPCASLVWRVDRAVCLASDTPIQSSLWSAEAGLSEDCRVREERMEAADSRPFKKFPLLMASGAPTMECTSVNKD